MTAQVQRLLDLMALAVLVAEQDPAVATELWQELAARQVPQLVLQAHRQATELAILRAQLSPAERR